MKSMLGYRKKLLYALILIVGLLIALPMPVYAIADPDSPPEVNAVYVYEDLLEDGDCGVLIDYYLDYAVLPSETATEAYLGIFIDTDGVTQLKSVAPYTFASNNLKGYRWGLMWIYFSAAEVTTYSIDGANVALYSIWLSGNPTVGSGWAGDPPKTEASIDYWQTTGDSAVLLALRVLYYAQEFELAWTLDMLEETALGSRLTSIYGEPYFQAVIPNLRTIAPNAFSSGQYDPTMEDTDYSTSFGAIMTDGTGTLGGGGSPLTLTEGANTVNIAVGGTFTLELNKGTQGTVESIVGGGVVTGSPVTIKYGTNTITSTAAGTGNISVTVNLVNTQTTITDTITGTGLDLSAVATRFGMTTMMFSGLIWLIISIVICAAVYRMGEQSAYTGTGKVVMIVFDLCIIGGAVLGLLSVLVAVLLFIGFGAFTGYVLFFRGANV